jgi:hypothetical protein
MGRPGCTACRDNDTRRYVGTPYPDLIQGHGAALRDGARLGQAHARKHVHRLGENKGTRAERGCAVLELGEELHEGEAGAVG